MPSPAGTRPSPSINSQKRPAEMPPLMSSKRRVPRSTLIRLDSNIINVQSLSGGPMFKVYADKLSLSPYLDKLQKDQHQRSAVILPRSIDLEKFEVYIYFLYTGTLATETAGPNNILDALRAETAILGKLYRFGIVMQDPKFRNTILGAIIDISHLKDKVTLFPHLPDPGIFSDLPNNSPARRCVLDLYVHFMDPADPAIDLPANTKFMREVLKASMRKSDVNSEHGSFRRQNLRRCDCHEHESGVRCDGGDEK